MDRAPNGFLLVFVPVLVSVKAVLTCLAQKVLDPGFLGSGNPIRNSRMSSFSPLALSYAAFLHVSNPISKPLEEERWPDFLDGV